MGIPLRLQGKIDQECERRSGVGNIPAYGQGDILGSGVEGTFIRMQQKIALIPVTKERPFAYQASCDHAFILHVVKKRYLRSNLTSILRHKYRCLRVYRADSS